MTAVRMLIASVAWCLDPVMFTWPLLRC